MIGAHAGDARPACICACTRMDLRCRNPTRRANRRGQAVQVQDMATLQSLLGIDVPVIQAPMAGVQLSALAVAVSNAGGLGSLPCAMLAPDAMRKELSALRAGTAKPYNVNFFCHAQPAPSAEREAAWRKALAPYFAEYGIDPATIPSGPGRLPFS